MKRQLTTAVTAFAFSLTLGFAAQAESGVRILKYDKDGRAVKTESKRIKKPKTGAPASNQNRYSPSKDFDETEVLVVGAPSDFALKAAQKGFSVKEQTTLAGIGLTISRVSVPAGKSVKSTSRSLRQSFSGLRTAPNHFFNVAAGPLRTHARAAMRWKPAAATCGKGTRIGLIDTGIDIKHPAFRPGAVSTKSFTRRGKKPVLGDHGTSVAAMLIGSRKWGGILPGAKIYAANIFERTSDGRVIANTANLVRAIDWLVQNRVQVVNVSVAGADNPIVKAAVQRAKKKGLVLVAAAGNWGPRSHDAYPAAYKDVLAVTAVQTNLKAYPEANRGDYIDFAAPGVRIWSAVPGGGRFRTGTSFATPFITAVAAAQMRTGRAKNAASLRKILSRNVKDLGKKGKDDTFGWGLQVRPPSCK